MSQQLSAIVLGPPVQQPYTPALMRAAKILSDRRAPGEEMHALVVEHVDPAGKLLLARSRAAASRDFALACQGQNTTPSRARVLIRHDALCAAAMRKSERRGKLPSCRCAEPRVDIVEPSPKPEDGR